MNFKKILPIIPLFLGTATCLLILPNTNMKCSYGERGSLTATCVNANASFFRLTPYRFDHLDETVRCINCNLAAIYSNTFDITGNLIITLNLDSSNITSLAQSSFAGLVYMKNLILSNNKIRNVVPGTFKGVKKVVYLNMANNNISVLLSEAFTELLNLTALDLSSNLIKQVDSHSFKGLASLKRLYLQNNLISDLKDVFIGLDSILLINLENNVIEQIRITELNTSSLVELNMGRNKLISLEADTFLVLSNLETLHLCHNYISKVASGAFRGLKALEVLNLNNNSLADLQPDVFIRLYNLRNINLSYNKLNLWRTVIFSVLPELRFLNLSHNSITDIQRTGITALHSLHSLDLSYNAMTDLDYKSLLRHAPKLTYIEMENNSWPCYLMEEIREYYKEDNVHFVIDSKYTASNISCNTTRETPVLAEAKEIAEAEAAAFDASRSPSPSSASIYVLYSIVFVLIALVAVLYYLQYRTYNYFKGSNRDDIAEVRLITSSGLENRDNDY